VISHLQTQAGVAYNATVM